MNKTIDLKKDFFEVERHSLPKTTLNTPHFKTKERTDEEALLERFDLRKKTG